MRPSPQADSGDGTGGLMGFLCVDDQLEVLDEEGFWYPAHVLQVQDHAVQIHYDGWPADDDEWVPTTSKRLREHLGWGSERMPNDFQQGSLIEALDLEGKWYPAKVRHSAAHAVLVHYQGWAAKWDEWIDRASGRLRFLETDAAAGRARQKQAPCGAREAGDVCSYCEKAHGLIRCNGECRRSFHTACLPHDSTFLDESSAHWRCSDCESQRHRCFFCKEWAPRQQLRACTHKMGGKRCCGKLYHEECLVATLHRFQSALSDVSSGSSLAAGPPSGTQRPSAGDEDVPAHVPPVSSVGGDGLPWEDAPRDQDALGRRGGALLPNRDDARPVEVEPSAGNTRAAIDSSSRHGSFSCALHWCATCGEAESPGYGRSMHRCFRCCVAHHHKCMRATDGTARAALVLTHNTMVCPRCYHLTPMGLTAPDPRRLPDDVALTARHGSAGSGGLPPYPAEVTLKRKALGPPSSGENADFCEFQLCDDILVQLREQQILPTGDFGPPPYARLRRSVYLGQRREILPICDVAACQCSIETGGCDYRCQNRAQQQECELATCPCAECCLNRPFSTQNDCGSPPFELFLTEKKGWGVKATRSITEGELVVEYVGEVIDRDTWEERKATLSRHAHMYFMALNHNEIVDASRKGNVARFINHSCSPNLSVQKWYVKREPRLGLFASMQIAEGEELSYNYAMKWSGEKKMAQRCLCEAPNCTGYLGKPPNDSSTR